MNLIKIMFLIKVVCVCRRCGSTSPIVPQLVLTGLVKGLWALYSWKNSQLRLNIENSTLLIVFFHFIWPYKMHCLLECVEICKCMLIVSWYPHRQLQYIPMLQTYHAVYYAICVQAVGRLYSPVCYIARYLSSFFVSFFFLLC